MNMYERQGVYFESESLPGGFTDDPREEEQPVADIIELEIQRPGSQETGETMGIP